MVIESSFEQGSTSGANTVRRVDVAGNDRRRPYGRGVDDLAQPGVLEGLPSRVTRGRVPHEHLPSRAAPAA